ncbi:hypothetical protein [Citrobacter gillenii]|jgi:hypothetical protein|uniref:hypothetical protein n=1 Tax=Citrobacter gillenii TaxID=67828 RepID=UPI00311CB22D
MYSADGKLESREYRKTQNGIIKEIIDYYDSHGKVDKYTEKYGGDPIFETTYNTSGNVLIRKTYMIAEGREKEEQFNDESQLTDLSQTENDYKQDGQQIQTSSRGTIFSFYENGVQQGGSKTIKDGRIIIFSRYVNGESTDDYFRMQDDEKSIVFSHPQAEKTVNTIYRVDVNYIHYDQQGMPQVKLPFKLDSRIMPEKGTIWKYSFDGKSNRQIKMQEVKDNIVTYQFGM